GFLSAEQLATNGTLLAGHLEQCFGNKFGTRERKIMIRKTQIKRVKPPKKKTSARRIKQQLDLLLRERMLERDNYQCQANGEGGIVSKPGSPISACHVMPKGKWSVLR